MPKETLHGHYEENGSRDASNWGMDDIRRATGWDRLQTGTVNVRLAGHHAPRPDYHLPRQCRSPEYGHSHEDLKFEICVVLLPCGARVRALIAQTSTNYWGQYNVIELMAEQHLRTRYNLKGGDRIDVEVWTGHNGG
jgi:CTP-dependent riboflavin kinase